MALNGQKVTGVSYNPYKRSYGPLLPTGRGQSCTPKFNTTPWKMTKPEDDPFLLGWCIFRAHVKLPGSMWDWLVLGLLFTTCYAYLHYLAMIVAMCRAPAEYQVPKMKVVKVTRSLFFCSCVFSWCNVFFLFKSIYTSCFNEFMPGFQYFINIELRKTWPFNAPECSHMVLTCFDACYLSVKVL